MIDLPVYLIVRALIGALNLFPLQVRLGLVTAIIRAVVFFIPSFNRVSRKNLTLAFPNQTPEWIEQTIRASQVSLARVIVDFARMQHLDAAWVEKHVDCAFLDRYKQMKAENPEKGIVLVTGHLGSFELLAHCVPMYGYPISFVVRPFKLRRLNAWWTGIREAYGNKAISRDGAFREVVKDLAKGRDVAVLFDQNVTRNHAVFVDWFGKPAATTKIVALAAIRTEAPIIITSIAHLGNDQYKIAAEERNFSALYADTSLSTDEKVVRITAEVSKAYEQMIAANPNEWFWMHKRWKTTEREGEKNMYQS